MRGGLAIFVCVMLGSALCEAADTLDAHDILDLSASGFRPALIVRILRERGDSVVISENDLRELERAGVDEQILAYLRARERAHPVEGSGAPGAATAEPQLMAAPPRLEPGELEPALKAPERDPRRRESMPSILPARGEITSGYGYRSSPVSGERRFHGGIDIAAAAGADIVATAAGRVLFAGDLGLLGQAVIIDHGSGLRTTVGHAGALHVRAGQQVERGDRIASAAPNGSDVHYGVELSGQPVDPLDYVRR